MVLVTEHTSLTTTSIRVEKRGSEGATFPPIKKDIYIFKEIWDYTKKKKNDNMHTIGEFLINNCNW